MNIPGGRNEVSNGAEPEICGIFYGENIRSIF